MAQATKDTTRFGSPPLPHVARQMGEACARFLDSLSAGQRKRATFPIDHYERFIWHYAPIPSRGLPLGDMDARQKGLAYALVASAMSPIGAEKTRAIIELETILGELERKAGTVVFPRDPGLYFLRVFGDPNAKALWGWSLNGHHAYLSFTVVDGALIASMPNFLGSNPAEVPSGPRKGHRILMHTEEMAAELFKSLDKGQRAKALLSEVAPLDIITTNSPKIVDGPGSILPPDGLPVGKMSKSQQAALERLLGEYVGRLRDELAQPIWKNLKEDGFERLTFSWAGGTEKGEGKYFRIHRMKPGSFLVEQDNVQNGANHIHSVLRDFDEDYGTDLLRLHYEGAHVR
ncbi:MAG: DUF3500 domain-containing protein [SAR202 cluster bacterium]|nr:DUF3500 domain-containing protein [SAR202 cluster bacterium]